ncbi:unnamed protein product [Lampetra planeri]
MGSHLLKITSDGDGDSRGDAAAETEQRGGNNSRVETETDVLADQSIAVSPVLPKHLPAVYLTQVPAPDTRLCNARPSASVSPAPLARRLARFVRSDSPPTRPPVYCWCYEPSSTVPTACSVLSAPREPSHFIARLQPCDGGRKSTSVGRFASLGVVRVCGQAVGAGPATDHRAAIAASPTKQRRQRAGRPAAALLWARAARRPGTGPCARVTQDGVERGQIRARYVITTTGKHDG